MSGAGRSFRPGRDLDRHGAFVLIAQEVADRELDGVVSRLGVGMRHRLIGREGDEGSAIAEVPPTRLAGRLVLARDAESIGRDAEVGDRLGRLDDRVDDRGRVGAGDAAAKAKHPQDTGLHPAAFFRRRGFGHVAVLHDRDKEESGGSIRQSTAKGEDQPEVLLLGV